MLQSSSLKIIILSIETLFDNTNYTCCSLRGQLRIALPLIFLQFSSLVSSSIQSMHTKFYRSMSSSFFDFFVSSLVSFFRGTPSSFNRYTMNEFTFKVFPYRICKSFLEKVTFVYGLLTLSSFRSYSFIRFSMYWHGSIRLKLNSLKIFQTSCLKLYSQGRYIKMF